MKSVTKGSVNAAVSCDTNLNLGQKSPDVACWHTEKALVTLNGT